MVGMGVSLTGSLNVIVFTVFLKLLSLGVTSVVGGFCL